MYSAASLYGMSSSCNSWRLVCGARGAIKPSCSRCHQVLFTLQMLCELTNLRHLTVVAETDDSPLACLEEEAGLQHDDDETRLAGLPAIPPAVSRLQSLRSLRLLEHTALHTLPPELFTLSR